MQLVSATQEHLNAETKEANLARAMITAFDAVQARLASNNPKVTPPRIVNGPTMLAGLGVCGEPGCGHGLLLQTGKSGRYRYYACQRRRTLSADACSLKHQPMALVDDIVVDAVMERLLTRERLGEILATLISRSDTALADRKQALGRLKAQRTEAQAAVARLWDAVEAGLARPSEADFAERMTAARERVARLTHEIDLLEAQDAAPTRRPITAEVLDRFAAMMREGLQQADPRQRQAYVRLIVNEVTLSNTALTITGSRKTLASIVAATANATGNTAVPKFAQKWRTRKDSNL